MYIYSEFRMFMHELCRKILDFLKEEFVQNARGTGVWKRIRKSTLFRIGPQGGGASCMAGRFA